MHRGIEIDSPAHTLQSHGESPTSKRIPESVPVVYEPQLPGSPVVHKESKLPSSAVPIKLAQEDTSHWKNREIVRLKELNLLLEGLRKKQEEEVDRLRKRVKDLMALLTGSDGTQRNKKKQSQLDLIMQARMDEFLMILHSQAEELSHARDVIKEMGKAIQSTSSNHDYIQRDYENKLSAVKLAYRRLWDAYQALKTAPQDPSLLITSIPTENVRGDGTVSLERPSVAFNKRQEDFKVKRSKELLAKDDALHRPLTPEIIPAAEFSVIVKADTTTKNGDVIASVAQPHIYDASPFAPGDVRALEGFRPGKVYKKLNASQGEDGSAFLNDDPLADFRVNCGPMFVVGPPSKLESGEARRHEPQKYVKKSAYEQKMSASPRLRIGKSVRLEDSLPEANLPKTSLPARPPCNSAKRFYHNSARSVYDVSSKYSYDKSQRAATADTARQFTGTESYPQHVEETLRASLLEMESSAAGDHNVAPPSWWKVWMNQDKDASAMAVKVALSSPVPLLQQPQKIFTEKRTNQEEELLKLLPQRPRKVKRVEVILPH